MPLNPRSAEVLGDILRATTPVRLADDLGVARNTVLHDLADLELELEPFDIRLERTRLGITPIGARARVLLALDQVLRANLRHDDLAWLTSFVWDPNRLDVEALSLPLRMVFDRIPSPEATSACVGSVIDSLQEHFAAPNDIAIGGMLLRLALALSLPHDAQPPGEATDELRGSSRRRRGSSPRPPGSCSAPRTSTSSSRRPSSWPRRTRWPPEDPTGSP